MSGRSVHLGDTVAVPRDYAAHASVAHCPAGKVPISGGYYGGRSIQIVNSLPQGDGWLVLGYNNDYNVINFPGQTENLQALVVCAFAS